MVFATLLAAATPRHLAGEATAVSRLLRVRAQRPAPGQSSPWRPRRGSGHVTCHHHPGVQQEPSFFVISLAASAILEAIAGIINWRSRMLLNGVKDLLNDQKLTGLAGQLYSHALINLRNNGKIEVNKKNPAYIDPLQFGRALIDVLNHG